MNLTYPELLVMATFLVVIVLATWSRLRWPKDRYEGVPRNELPFFNL